MIVEELEDLLARLPSDMLVHVATMPMPRGWMQSGIGARHVSVADKRPRQRAEKVTFIDGEPCPEPWRGMRTVLIPGDGSYVIPPSLILRGGPLWFDDEPDYEIHGRWPRAKERAA